MKSKFQPARPENAIDASNGLIADIDAIIERPSYFRLHGTIHQIRPMLVEEFWAVANALAEIGAMNKTDKLSLDEVIDKYYNLIHSVCATIQKDDLYRCNQAQLAALMQHFYDHVNGVTKDEKKKQSPILTMSRLQ